MSKKSKILIFILIFIVFEAIGIYNFMGLTVSRVVNWTILSLLVSLLLSSIIFLLFSKIRKK